MLYFWPFEKNGDRGGESGPWMILSRMMMIMSCSNKGRNGLLVSNNWNRYQGVKAQAMTGILVLCAHIVSCHQEYTVNTWILSNTEGMNTASRFMLQEPELQ